jgi:hypothetical protein
MRVAAMWGGLLIFASTAFGQVPNGDFENWTVDVDGNNNPDGWEVTNSNPLITVEPFTPAHQGSYAMRVKTVDVGGVAVLPGIAYIGAPVSFSEVPTRFGAWIRTTIMPGDTAFLLLALTKGDTVVAATDSCTFRIHTSYATYTYLEFPIAIVSNKVPDSLYVMIASSLTSNPQVGTEIIVDDIAFLTTPTSVTGGTGPVETYELSQNYPNPFNPGTVFSYQLPVGGMVRLSVFDLLGREIAVLVDEFRPAGRHSAAWNASRFAAGAYLLRMTAGSYIATRKVVLVK